MIDAIVIGAAVGGLLIGFVLGRVMAPRGTEARDLRKQLEDAQSEQQQLNRAVRRHFEETADKLNRLTEQYRDVHQHMAAGAAALCGGEGAAAFTALEAPRDIEGELAASDEAIDSPQGAEPVNGERSATPPRDYATDK